MIKLYVAVVLICLRDVSVCSAYDICRVALYYMTLIENNGSFHEVVATVANRDSQ